MVSQGCLRTCYEGRREPATKPEIQAGIAAPGRGWSKAEAAVRRRPESWEDCMRWIARAAVAAAGLAFITASTASSAWAQQRIRGQIEKAEGPSFTLKTRDGGTLHVKL